MIARALRSAKTVPFLMFRRIQTAPSRLARNVKSRLTMVQTGAGFWDPIGSIAVKRWRDCYGDEWLAGGRFGFRCEAPARGDRSAPFYREAKK